MFRVIFCLTVAVSLSACGGGGTVNTPVVLKTYNDGSGVVTGSPDLGDAGGPSNLVIAASDIQVAEEVAGGSVATTVTSQGVFGDFGQFYIVTRTGVASNGAALEIITAGETLNFVNLDYVAMSIVGINDEAGVLSAGSKPTNLPNGTFSYSGVASVLSEDEIGDGTVTVTANFSSKTANIVASVPANSGVNTLPYFFSANNMAINTNDGSFHTGNGSIGITGQTSNSASIKGYFAGTNATGVHGVAYPNSDDDEIMGVFYGSR